MAFPVVVGTPAETAISTASLSHVVNLPAGATGNLLLAICDKGSSVASVSALAGWTELLDENVANGLYIAYRVADGSEGATTTFTLTGTATRGAWIVYEISGHEDIGTQAPQIGTTSTGTSATPDPPASATPTSAREYLVIACAGMAGEEADDDTWANTPPTNYTPSPPRQKSCGVAGTNLGGKLVTAEREIALSAAENPGTFDVDVSAAWRAQTILIPAPIPPGAPSSIGTPAFSATSDTTLAFTVGTAVPAGERVIVVAGDDGSNAPLSSCVDSRGNTYVTDCTPLSLADNYRGRIMSSRITTALQVGDTITVTFAGRTGTWDTFCACYKTTAVGDVDEEQEGTGTGTAWSSGNTAVTSQAEALVFGLAVAGGAPASSTPGSGLTELFDSGGASAFIDYTTVYKLVNATGAQAVNGTWNTSDNWGAAVVVYPLAGGVEYTDSATAVLALTPSGTENKEILDSATALLKLTPSGTDVLYETFEFTEAGMPQESCEIGPWKAPNGSFYCVLPHPTNRNQLQVFKASDPTSAWSRAGDYIIADIASGSVGIAAKLVGTTIHIAHALIGSGVAYHAFDTATDTWSVTDEHAHTGKVSGFFAGVGLGVRSDGDIIILYSAEETPASGFCEAYYSRREGGVWTREILVADENTHPGSAGSINVGTIAVGASDRLFLIYTDTAVGLCCRSLSSANVLGTPTTLSATTAGDQISGAPFSHTSDTKVGVLHANGAGNLVVTEWDDAATPVPTTTTISDNAVAVDDGPLAGVAVNGSDRHTVFTDSATSDVFYDKNTGSGWGTDQEIHDAVTANKISANVYERSGTVLAYIWKNGATPEYDEIVLATIYTDSATAILALVPSATENAQLTDSATLLLALTPSAVEIREQFDAATVLIALTPSSTDVADYIDSDTLLLDLVPSGTEAAQGETSDAGTLNLLLQPNSSDIADYLDSAISQLLLTPSAADIAEYIDSAIVLVLLSPSGVDVVESIDSAQPVVILTPGAVEFTEYIDSAVIPLSLLPNSTEEYTRFDSAIAQLLLTPSAVDVAEFVDGVVVPLLLKPSQVLEGDTGTLELKLTPITVVEIRFLFDTLLVATVYQHWSMTVTQKWSGIMYSKWFGIMLNRLWSGSLFGTKWGASVKQRWGTIYKGTG